MFEPCAGPCCPQACSGWHAGEHLLQLQKHEPRAAGPREAVIKGRSEEWWAWLSDIGACHCSGGSRALSVSGAGDGTCLLRKL